MTVALAGEAVSKELKPMNASPATARRLLNVRFIVCTFWVIEWVSISKSRQAATTKAARLRRLIA
jgi:hypothetical protein